MNFFTKRPKPKPHTLKCRYCEQTFKSSNKLSWYCSKKCLESDITRKYAKKTDVNIPEGDKKK